MVIAYDYLRYFGYKNLDLHFKGLLYVYFHQQDN